MVKLADQFKAIVPFLTCVYEAKDTESDGHIDLGYCVFFSDGRKKPIQSKLACGVGSKQRLGYFP